MNNKVIIKRLATQVPGLDNIIGGGLPEFSFNLIGGMPGSGKTTLAHQIMFSLASSDRRALFFTVLGEPPLKMLRYQQQFSFFDIDKVNDSIHFINLAAYVKSGNLDQVLNHISKEVEDYAPSLVFVDSFRSIVDATKSSGDGSFKLQLFLQQLGMQMASWQATTFLIGEYSLSETESHPIYTLADGILWLTQKVHRNSAVRKIQAVKMRGQALKEGLHTFRIHDNGIQIFPRATIQQGITLGAATQRISKNKRSSVGITELDEMLGGGLPAGYSLLVVGPSGSGKTILATDFLAEGVRNNEFGLIAAFEKDAGQLLNSKLNRWIEDNQIGIINTRALDMSIEEILHDLIAMIRQTQAKRVVLDSLGGFELALAPEFREEFRASLYWMMAELSAMEVNILMTSEYENSQSDFRYNPYGSAFFADAIIAQRYVEIDGQMKRVMSVMKVRGSKHSQDIRLFEITDEGIIIGKTLSGYQGIMSGNTISSK